MKGSNTVRLKKIPTYIAVRIEDKVVNSRLLNSGVLCHFMSNWNDNFCASPEVKYLKKIERLT